MSLPDIPAISEINSGRYPFNIAVVIDNVVYSVLNLPGSQAALYAAQPTFVQVDFNQVVTGSVYNPADGTFTDPEVNE
jgi:hypothetical protein